MGVENVTIDVTEIENGISLEINGDGFAEMIGAKGELLDSLQYLASLVCNKVDREYFRITTDSNGFRERRKKQLEELAAKIANNVKRSGRSSALEPMLTIIANIVIMVALTLFTGRTKMGKAMRAVSEDKGAAELMGINVNRTISVTFAIGSALAAIAGVLLCSAYPTLQPTTGSMPGIKAFTAAVFGGIGSIPGAMIGGLLLGIIEILGKAYISTELGDAIVFAVLIVVLLFKPAGLLGKPISEKV
ncbi:MAG: KH domain-containing protein [Clostridia bacterium]|nr:KH domain-containing protein [Clostridia bacterium]